MKDIKLELSGDYFIFKQIDLYYSCDPAISRKVPFYLKANIWSKVTARQQGLGWELSNSLKKHPD